MCRILGYFGPPVPVSTQVIDPPHGLLHQSRSAREMTDSETAGDGWGAGWFSERGKPGVMKSILPLWSDQNATAALPAIVSGSFVGHVRLASPGVETCFLNTPVYLLDNYLFTINGGIEPWPGPISRKMRSLLDEEAESAVQGSSDGEMIAALWRTALGPDRRKDPAAALKRMVSQITSLVREVNGTARANIIIAAPHGLIAVKYAFNTSENSLYTHGDERHGDQARIVASEPLDDGPNWSPIKRGSLVRINREGTFTESLGGECEER